jgi:hypothetical protein
MGNKSEPVRNKKNVKNGEPKGVVSGGRCRAEVRERRLGVKITP